MRRRGRGEVEEVTLTCSKGKEIDPFIEFRMNVRLWTH